MITIRPSVFCFLGRVAQDLHAAVPGAVRRRLGVVPDVFAFLSVTDESVDLKLGTRRPKLPPAAGALQNRVWGALTYASAAIGNIRVRTDALRRPEEAESGFQVVRGGPDIYLVQCLSDPMGWELAFALAEKIHQRNETPPSAGRARGIFPTFHLPSADEDAEREQAVEGLRRLEGLVERGVLFPSVVLDRVNRNGYPLEKWEDLTELLVGFLALGSASEAAPDIWGIFPQVADLHATSTDVARGGSPGISSIGLSRFRFNKQLLAEELARFYRRDLKRSLARTFSSDAGGLGLDEGRALLEGLVQRKLASSGDGLRTAQEEMVQWVRGANPGKGPTLGTWAGALDRLQKMLFEMLGDAAQRIENGRQEREALAMETPLRDTWIARLSVILPRSYLYVPAALLGAVIGTFLGMVFAARVPLEGYMVGGTLGAGIALALAYVFRKRLTRQIFTLGEFPQSSLTEGISAPRTLERFSRMGRPGERRRGVNLQLWGELRNQLEPEAKARLEAATASVEQDLEVARGEEAELIFLDRAVNLLREAVGSWRAHLAESEIWEPAQGFSGDIFPADGPRKVYESCRGAETAQEATAAILAGTVPSDGAASIMEVVDENAARWGVEIAGSLELRQVLDILDDRPEDLMERLSEAAAPLWPRPGDRDELLRCFGEDFLWMAQPTDLRSSVKDETVFIRVLGMIRSGEFAHT